MAEARIVQTWLACHDAASLDLHPMPDRAALGAFVMRAAAGPTGAGAAVS